MIRHMLPYILILICSFTFRLMPIKLALWFGARLGDLGCWTYKERREIALKNLQLAFGGEKSEAEIKIILRRSFQNLGKNLVEFLRFPKFNEKNINKTVKVVGEENLYNGLKLGRGVVVFTAHLGNWEMLAPVYGTLAKGSVVAFPLKNPHLNRMVSKYRSALGTEIIPKRQAIRQVLKDLRANYVVGFLADQDAGQDGVFVNFFGKPASAVKSPALVSLKTGAPLLISLDVRQPDDTHVLIISEPLNMQISGDLEHDVAVNTQQLISELEGYIRKYPDQWMWQHNRWKTQP